MDEQDTQDFGSRSELFLSSVFELFVAGRSLSFCLPFFCRAFQIQWQKNAGQENEAGEYQMLLPTAVSKKTCFLVCPKNVSLGAKGDYFRNRVNSLTAYQ
jgi:hypothetical protein